MSCDFAFSKRGHCGSVRYSSVMASAPIEFDYCTHIAWTLVSVKITSTDQSYKGVDFFLQKVQKKYQSWEVAYYLNRIWKLSYSVIVNTVKTQNHVYC